MKLPANFDFEMLTRAFDEWHASASYNNYNDNTYYHWTLFRSENYGIEVYGDYVVTDEDKFALFLLRFG